MSRKSTVLILGCVIVLGVATLVVPRLIHPRSTKAMLPCVNNLRQLDGAKQRWELENRKTANDVPTWEDLRPYFPDWWTNGRPVCPEGGTYTLGRVGESPRCSIGGPEHTLP
jgi:hypothetical protein